MRIAIGFVFLCFLFAWWANTRELCPPLEKNIQSSVLSGILIETTEPICNKHKKWAGTFAHFYMTNVSQVPITLNKLADTDYEHGVLVWAKTLMPGDKVSMGFKSSSQYKVLFINQAGVTFRVFNGRI